MHAQLVEKDPGAAIALFWKAINAGDKVDSALKDMAVVMKQQDRAEEAIEAIKAFRDRCSKHAQESLDNVLIDLYKVVVIIQLDNLIKIFIFFLKFHEKGLPACVIYPVLLQCFDDIFRRNVEKSRSR